MGENEKRSTRISGRIRPDMGNTEPAAMDGLGSIGLNLQYIMSLFMSMPFLKLMSHETLVNHEKVHVACSFEGLGAPYLALL